jgi:hypothetical protein
VTGITAGARSGICLSGGQARADYLGDGDGAARLVSMMV